MDNDVLQKIKKRLTVIIVLLATTTTVEVMEAFFGFEGMSLLG